MVCMGSSSVPVDHSQYGRLHRAGEPKTPDALMHGGSLCSALEAASAARLSHCSKLGMKVNDEGRSAWSGGRNLHSSG